MNRIQRTAAAAAVGTAVLVPATATMAGAEPYPWHNSDDSRSAVGPRPKAQIEYEKLNLPGPHDPAVQPAADESGFPWDTVGLLTLGVGAIAAGGVRWLAVVANRDRPYRDHPRSGREVTGLSIRSVDRAAPGSQAQENRCGGRLTPSPAPARPPRRRSARSGSP